MTRLITYLIFSLLGVLLLTFLETVQKIAIDAPLIASGYIVPILFGGTAGLLLGIWVLKLREAPNRLQQFNVQLEQEVTQRTFKIQESNNKLNLLLASISEGLYEVDTDGHCTFVNRSALETLGYQNESLLLGKKMHELIHHSHADGCYYDEVDCPMCRAWKQGEGIYMDNEVLWRKDGSSFAAEYRSFPLHCDDIIVGAVVTFSDITERKLVEMSLLESEAKFRSTFQTAVVGMIVVVDEKEIISEWNTGAEKSFGYSAPEVMGKSLTMLIPERYREAHLKGFARAVEQGGLTHTGVTHELVGLHKNGSEFPLELTLGCWKRDGKLQASAIILDITERKQAEVELQHMATHDPLTGIYNRNALEQRITDEMRRASRYLRSLSVFMLDIDHFKLVNDDYGHQAGDIVLSSFAQTLKRTMREADFVARYGGEEFIILLPETALPKAKELAERLCKQIAKSSISIMDKKVLNITASIGVSTFPEHADSWLDLLNVADSAMYAAKNSGRNCVRVAKNTI